MGPMVIVDEKLLVTAAAKPLLEVLETELFAAVENRDEDDGGTLDEFEVL